MPWFVIKLRETMATKYPDTSAGDTSKTASWKLAVALPAVLAAMILLAFFFHLAAIQDAQRTLSGAVAASVAAEVETSLSSVIAAGADLAVALEDTASLREDSPGTQARMAVLLAKVAGTASYVTGVSVAPSAIVRYHHPPLESQSLLGHDLLSNPERRDDLVRAAESKSPVVTGPYESVEGTPTYFVRYPIFADATLWGFISLSIDFSTLLTSFDFENKYPGLAFDYAFTLSAATDPRNSIDVPGGRWEVAVKTSGKILPFDAYLLILLIGASFGPALLFLVLRPQQSLRAASRTSFRPRRAEKRGVDRVANESLFTLESPEPEPAAAISVASSPQAPERHHPAAHHHHEKTEGRYLGPTLFPGLAPLVEMSGRELTFKGPDVKGELYMPESGHEPQVAAEPAKAPSPAPEPQEPKPRRIHIEETPAPPSAPPSSATVRPPSAAPSAATVKPRILVVDDSEANRDIMGRMLGLRGYSAEFAASGDEALLACAKSRPQIIFMDCFMPGLDGYETTRRIRSGEGTAKSRIIGMSARIGEAEKSRCLEAGMNDLLAKPFTLGELVAQLADRP